MNASKKFSSKYRIMDVPYTPYESAEVLKKRLIAYKKLVVPTRMRSVYWKYFGFPADEDGRIITKDKIICTFCKIQMINNHNTSNLRMHLISKHRDEMVKIDPTALTVAPKSAKSTSKLAKSKKRKAAEPQRDDFDDTSILIKTEADDFHVVVSEEGNEQEFSDIAILFPNDLAGEYDRSKEQRKESMESTEMTDTIVNFIISDLLSPDIISGPGFHCLMSNVSDKTVVMPSERQLVNDIIPTIFNSCKEQLYSSLQASGITNVSLSMEEWSCANSIKCISIYLHFTQNSEPALKTRLLRTISYTGSESESYWTGILDRLLQEWLIDVDIVAAVIVSFTNDGLLKAIKAKNLVTVPCLVHVIQQMCDDYCFNHSQIEPMLVKCRKLVKYLKDNRIEFRDENQITSDLVEFEDEDAGSSLGPDKQDLWLTTYFMLNGLIHKKTSIEEAVLNLDAELIHVAPTEEEWTILEDIVSLLEPLKTIVITMFEEKNLLVSLLKPLVWKASSSKFDSNDKDSKLTQELKQRIKQTLNDAYGEPEVNTLTQFATLLDPRFKHFIQKKGETDLEATLVESLTNFVDTKGSSSSRLSAAQQEIPAKKSSRVSGINSLLGNICERKPVMTVQERIKEEVKHYLSESSAVLEQCPLDWWYHMSHKYPNLSRLAYRYHCIPAVVTHAANYSLLEFVKFHQKRSVLNVDIADALLFLHSNKNIL